MHEEKSLSGNSEKDGVDSTKVALRDAESRLRMVQQGLSQLLNKLEEMEARIDRIVEKDPHMLAEQ